MGVKYHEKRIRKPHYKTLAAAIAAVAPAADSILDIGCSCGALLDECGQETKVGLDSSKDAAMLFYPQDAKFVLYNLEEDFHTVGQFDIISCMEVPEHVLNWENLLDVLDTNSNDDGCTLVWSAAPPGQRGKGHVNLQPYRWWREVLGSRGWTLDLPATHTFVDLVGGKVPPHYEANTRIYHK